MLSSKFHKGHSDIHEHGSIALKVSNVHVPVLLYWLSSLSLLIVGDGEEAKNPPKHYSSSS